MKRSFFLLAQIPRVIAARIMSHPNQSKRPC